jgi:hypothetical protein
LKCFLLFCYFVLFFQPDSHAHALMHLFPFVFLLCA